MAEITVQMTTAGSTSNIKNEADSSLIKERATRPTLPALQVNLDLKRRSFQSLSSSSSAASLSMMSLSAESTPSSLYSVGARRVHGSYGPRSRGSPASSPLAGPVISSRSSSPTPSEEEKVENDSDKGKGKDKVIYRPNRISNVPSFRMSLTTPEGVEPRPSLRRPASMAGYFDETMSSTAGFGHSQRLPNTLGVHNTHVLRRPHSGKTCVEQSNITSSVDQISSFF